MNLAFDIKQFFRFVVSGYVFILYYAVLLFALSDPLTKLAPYLRFRDIATVVPALFVAGLALAVPIGFVIHEIDVLLLNGFWKLGRYRTGRERLPLETIRGFVPPTERNSLDRQYLQALLEFAKFSKNDVESKNEVEGRSGAQSNEDHEDTDYCASLNAHLDKEISNRYSYLYARIETGIYAPIIAWFVFVATVQSMNLDCAPLNWFGWAVVITVALSALLFGYCPRLLKEIDALEILIVLDRRDEILRLIALLGDVGLVHTKAER